jgi:hypothetical protein
MDQNTDRNGVSRAKTSTSRRGLFAAAVVAAAALSTRNANALWLAPRDPGKPGDGGGRCFLRGTRIRTADGDVAIETLSVGDMVCTLDGSLKPIKWIGRQVVERRSDGTWKHDMAPVRVARSALSHLVPENDLYLSPMHALYIDGVLVPVKNLINGRTIAQAAVDGDTIEYFHIQLASHDVVLAEGAPAETLLTVSDPALDGSDATTLDRLPPDDEGAVPYAPVQSARGRDILKSRLRTAAAPLIDLRQPVDHIWERLAERADASQTKLR